MRTRELLPSDRVGAAEATATGLAWRRERDQAEAQRRRAQAQAAVQAAKEKKKGGAERSGANPPSPSRSPPLAGALSARGR